MLDNFRVRLASLGPLALRVGFGLGFVLHGTGKFYTMVNGQGPIFQNLDAPGWINWINPEVTLSWMIASTEFVGGLCLLLGLLTRFWAAGGAIAMAVALSWKHSDGFIGMWRGVADAVSALFGGNWAGVEAGLAYARDTMGQYHSEMAWLYGMAALALFVMGPGCWSLDHLFGLIFRRRKANAVVGMGMRFPAREPLDKSDDIDSDPVYNPESANHPRLD